MITHMHLASDAFITTTSAGVITILGTQICIGTITIHSSGEQASMPELGHHGAGEWVGTHGTVVLVGTTGVGMQVGAATLGGGAQAGTVGVGAGTIGVGTTLIGTVTIRVTGTDSMMVWQEGITTHSIRIVVSITVIAALPEQAALLVQGTETRLLPVFTIRRPWKEKCTMQTREMC